MGEFTKSEGVRDPRFDTALGAWVLTRYEDVLAALGDDRLSPVRASGPGEKGAEDQRLRLRADILDVLSPGTLASWQGALCTEAHRRFEAMATDHPVDLVAEFLYPWGLDAAATVTGVDRSKANELAAWARIISAAAAEPQDAARQAEAARAQAQLTPHFPSGPAPLRAGGFVALSHTLPRLLAGFWYALLQEPGQCDGLRTHPELWPSALEELFRYAGLVRTLRRTATADVEINGRYIAAGEQVILRLTEAHFDPAHYQEPEAFDLSRRHCRHFALGSGPHSCVGAALIRMLVTVATREFVSRSQNASLIRPVVWNGGAGFRWPEPLVVRLECSGTD